MVLGLGDLLGGKIGGVDALEMPGQRQRSLTVAGAAIPGQIVAGALLCQPGEQFGRVGWPGFRVVGGVARKVVGGQGLRPFR